jgi:hypothetical protein
VIFGYVDMTVYFNEKKYQQLGFMHLKVDVIIFSRNESVFDFSRLRTTIYNWKNKRSLNSHKRYLSFKNALFFPSTLLEAPTIPLKAFKHKFFQDINGLFFCLILKFLEKTVYLEIDSYLT